MAQPDAAPPDLSHIADALRPLAVPIGTLTNDPANAKKHGQANIDGIAASLRVYGQQKPVVVRRETMAVVAGNGQLMAARALGWSHIAANVVSMDAATAAGYAVVDNRSGEVDVSWDAAVLDGLLKDVNVGADEALDKMLAELAAAEGLYATPAAVEDEPPPVPKVAVSKPGDLWLMGEHRLLCGDSTKAADVARVMGGERAGLCFTSPPYAQQRDYGKKIDDWDGLMQGVFGNLPMADDGQVLVNLGLIHRDGEWVPYWDGWIEWMRGQGWRRFGWYVWDQGSGLPGDWNGRLAPSHEFIWHFNRNTMKPEHCVPKAAKSIRDRTGDAAMRAGAETTQCTGSGKASLNTHKIPDSVFRIQRQCGRIESGDYHPAVYPVALPSVALQCWPGIAYEPFAGSGTTIIAAEQLNRRCFAIELEPLYVDVAVARWEKLTGKKATLEGATP